MYQLRLHRFGVAVAAAFLLAALVSAPRALAQATNTGTVVGTITDPSGAVIPGAAVTLSNASAGVTLRAQTNDTGSYVLQNVPPGTYTMTASKQGFSVAKASGVLVSVGTQTTLNLTLKVGSTAETVEVQTLGTELQTLNATVGSTIAPQAIESLPSLNHDVNTFAELQPGVSPNGSVAGAVNDQNMFLLDGGNNSNDMDGSNSIYTGSFAGDPTGVAGGGGVYTAPTGVMPTPQDSVEEVKVNTSNQTADFDNSAGGEIELVTPRGTNRWHGGVYEYYLDNGFDANSWQNNQVGTKIPQYHYSRFGGKAGGWILPAFWGGRTYFFGFYEGLRYPQSTTIEHAVPSANLRKGIVTWNGTNYDLSSGSSAVDPRGIGINPAIATMWGKYEPAGNDPGCTAISGPYCDGINEVGFRANMSLPLSSNDMAFRVDHAFSPKWNWYATYRYYKLTQFVNAQVDIGGFFPGDKLGTPASVSPRPQQPWYLATGLVTNITSNTTNDFHYSFLRNFWQWTDKNAPAQIPGLGGAVEPGGEASINYALIPFNVNTQSIRTRFWDGQDHFFSDNVSVLKGNHLLQFGGQYQHDYDYHQRSDNGGGINFTTTYQLGDSSGGGLVDLSGLGGGYPLGGSNALQEARVAAEVLGIVTDSQVAYTRSGPTLTLNPPLTHAFDQDTIPFYNAYFSDTWHMKPSITLTYGMGYTLEMPPNEKNGKATILVDSADEPVVTQDYMKQRQTDALQGQVYNPQLGFALLANTGAGVKYPYQPFYGSFSPRVGIAWNPSFSKATVIRGGYGRLYGRLNGVDLVLVPLLGVGLIQAVQCRQAFANGNCGPSNPSAATAFRVGVDGNAAPLPAAAPTLPQPAYPGFNLVAGSASEAMDPHFRPDDIDSFDLTIQRQIGQKMLLEVGYIGRLIHHEFQPVNLNAVPYMTSVGGQQFQQAYANLEKMLGCATSAGACGANVPAKKIGTSANPSYTAFINSVATQPFLETALAGSSYCNKTVSNGSGTPYASCTAAVLDNELTHLTQQKVWNLWSDLDNGGFNPTVVPRSMQNTPIAGSSFGSSGMNSSGIAENGSFGYGNYNGVFFTVGLRDWHGLTVQNNFTYSKALGTGAEAQATSEYTEDNPFNIATMYGEQDFDRRIVYNMYMVAQEPWFKSQHGLLGRVAGGWEFAPIFAAGSGPPVSCGTVGSESFGEGDDANYFGIEQCVFNTPYNAGHSAHFGVTGATDSYKNSIGTHTSKTPVNLFTNPVSVWNQVRSPILGIDTKDSGEGAFMGQPYWNMDAEIKKDIRIAESTTFEFSFISTNVLNHRQFADPSMNLGSPTNWGVLNSQTNPPRNMEFGGRIQF
jgi:hypothetical protein